MLIKVQIVLTALICICAGQDDERPQQWNINSYPDPIRQPQKCGRPGPSFLCDPNGIMSQSDGDAIDTILKDLYNETTVPLRCYDTQGSKRKGYLVMVAVLKKLEMRATSYENRFYYAQWFSYILNKYKWRHTGCGEATLIFYSAEDHIFYIMTQPLAREKLRDNLVRRITLQAISNHQVPWQPRSVFQALKFAAIRVSDALRKS